MDLIEYFTMDSLNNKTENSLPPINKIAALWGLTCLLLGLVFYESLDEMIFIWTSSEEYSHGFFIPIISLYLIWVQRQKLSFVKEFKSSFLGLGVLFVALLLFILGGLATIRTIQHYAFILALVGVFAAAFGSDG